MSFSYDYYKLNYQGLFCKSQHALTPLILLTPCAFTVKAFHRLK